MICSNNSSNVFIMYASVYISYISLYMNYSSDTMNGWEEIELFCYYNLYYLLLSGVVLFENGFELIINLY